VSNLDKYIDSLTGSAAKAMRVLRKAMPDEEMEAEARGALAAFAEHAVGVLRMAQEDPDDELARHHAEAVKGVQRGEAFALGVVFITEDSEEHRVPMIASTGVSFSTLYTNIIETMTSYWEEGTAQPFLRCLVQIAAGIEVIGRDGETEEESMARAIKNPKRAMSSSVVMVDGRIGTLVVHENADGGPKSLDWMCSTNGMTCRALHPADDLVLHYLMDGEERDLLFGDGVPMDGWNEDGWTDPSLCDGGSTDNPDGEDPVNDNEED